MQADEQELVELVRSTYDRAEATPWDVTPEQVRATRRHRVMTLPDPKVLALVAGAAVLIAFGIFFFRPTPTRTTSPPSSTTTVPGVQVAVPNVVGLTQADAVTVLGDAGLAVGTVTVASSTVFPTGTVIASNPPAQVSLGRGTAVDLTVSTGPGDTAGSAGTTVPSTTPVTPTTAGAPTSSTPGGPMTDCPSGDQRITVDASSATTCVRARATTHRDLRRSGLVGRLRLLVDGSPDGLRRCGPRRTLVLAVVRIGDGGLHRRRARIVRGDRPVRRQLRTG